MAIISFNHALHNPSLVVDFDPTEDILLVDFLSASDLVITAQDPFNTGTDGVLIETKLGNVFIQNLNFEQITSDPGANIAFSDVSKLLVGDDLRTTFDDDADNINYGSFFADQIHGRGGDDILWGRNGNDAISGGDGLDTLYGGSGHDTLLGEDGNDTIYGDDGDDRIFGDRIDLDIPVDVYWTLPESSLINTPLTTPLRWEDICDDFTAAINANPYYSAVLVGEKIEITHITPDTNFNVKIHDPQTFIDSTIPATTVTSQTTIIDSGDGYIEDGDRYEITLVDENGDGQTSVIYVGGQETMAQITSSTLDLGTYFATIINQLPEFIATVDTDGKVQISHIEDNTPFDFTHSELLDSETIPATESTPQISTLTFPNDRALQLGDLYQISFFDPEETYEYKFSFTVGHEKGMFRGWNDELSYPDNGDDLIFGGEGNDFIQAHSGLDSVDGEGGNDWIMGWSGNDSLLGGDGDDTLLGGDIDIFGTDMDTIRGGAGNDWVNGNRGEDTIYGNDGDDFLRGGKSDDFICGGSGNDTLMGDKGDDSLVGETGDDFIYGRSGSDTIFGEDGDDWIEGSPEDFTDIAQEITCPPADIALENDFLYGGDGNDTIDGGASEDWIEGGSGNDSIIGGDSNDTISGGSANDTIDGGDGDDSIMAGHGKDLVYGGIGNDSIHTGRREDTVYGGSGNDSIYAGSDEDYVEGGTGEDIIYGSSGNDTIYGDNPDAHLFFNQEQHDTIFGGEDEDLIFGNSGDDLISGGLHNDTLEGGSGNDIFSFEYDFDEIEHDAPLADLRKVDGDGEDYIRDFDKDEDFLNINILPGKSLTFDDLSIDLFNETLIPVSYNAYLDEISIHLDNGDGDQVIRLMNQGISGEFTATNLAELRDIYGYQITFNQEIETEAILVMGTENDDTLIGISGGDTILAGNGDDLVYGNAGDDLLRGEGDNDTLYGGADDDTVFGDFDTLLIHTEIDVPPVVSPAEYDLARYFASILGQFPFTTNTWGNHLELEGRFDFTLSDDTITNLQIIPSVVAGTGTFELLDEDTLRFLDVIDGTYQMDITYTIGEQEYSYTFEYTIGDTEGIFTDNIIREYGNDLIYGEQGNDWGDGQSGMDILYGDAGLDTMLGGSGDDTIFGGADDDSLLGDAGNDLLFGDNGSDIMLGGSGDDTIFGGADDDSLLGNDGDDSIIGGSGDDFLLGNSGDDFLNGQSGDDTLLGHSGADEIHGGSGFDVIRGGNESDLISGGDDADWLLGESGDDIIFGGDGHDTISGGDENDSLYGEDGNDTIYGDRDDIDSETPSIDELKEKVLLELTENLDDAYTVTVVDNLVTIENTGHPFTLTTAGTALINPTPNALQDTWTFEFDPNALAYGDTNQITIDTQLTEVFNETETTEAGPPALTMTPEAMVESFYEQMDESLCEQNFTVTQTALDTIRIESIGGPFTPSAGEDYVGTNDIPVFTKIQDYLPTSGPTTEPVDLVLPGTWTYQTLADTFAQMIERADTEGLDVVGTSSSEGGRVLLSDEDGNLLNITGSVTASVGNAGEALYPSPVTADPIGYFNFEDTADLDIGDTYEVLIEDDAGTYSYLFSYTVGNDYATFTDNNGGPPVPEIWDITFPMTIEYDDAYTIDIVDEFGAPIQPVSSFEVIADENTQPSIEDLVDRFMVKLEADPDLENYEIIDAETSIIIKNADIDFTVYDNFANLELTQIDEGWIIHFGNDIVYDLLADWTWLEDYSFRIEEAAETILDVIVPITKKDGDDLIYGNDGNDLLFGDSGLDTIFGGDHSDTIIGGSGDDSLFGGSGHDSIMGNEDNDSIEGGTGNDSIYGGIGNDSILGNDDDDLIIAYSGDDTLFGNAGDDTLIGEDGNDLMYGNEEEDWLNGGSGDDSIFGGEQNDTILGEDGNDFLSGFDEDDSIWGGSGDDTLFGGEDNDTLEGNTGADWIFGGLGNDSIITGDGGAKTVIDIEGDNTIIGGDSYISLEGGIGNDLVYSGIGDDDLNGAGGNDTMLGGSGADNIWGGSGNDSLLGGSGDDIVYGEEGVDHLLGGSGDDLLYGGDGNDTLQGDTGADELYGDTGDDILLGQSNADDLFGGDGDDTISGGSAADNLFGESGNDLLDGGDGDDMIYGDIGADILSGGNGIDMLEGGSGDDTLFGGNGNDNLLGDGENDNLYGESGDDIMDGGVGNDLLSGGSGNDILTDLIGHNSIYGEDGDDIIAAGDGNDWLSGGDGDDIIDGGANNDHIYGGSGDDILTGGGGIKDRFFFEYNMSQVTEGVSHDNVIDMLGDGNDQITDFDRLKDVIFISVTFEQNVNDMDITQDYTPELIEVVGDTIYFDGVQGGNHSLQIAGLSGATNLAEVGLEEFGGAYEIWFNGFILPQHL
ncbi:MAG: calcium-binding protein [Alphaproteobacteria bacterium]